MIYRVANWYNNQGMLIMLISKWLTGDNIINVNRLFVLGSITNICFYLTALF